MEHINLGAGRPGGLPAHQVMDETRPEYQEQAVRLLSAILVESRRTNELLAQMVADTARERVEAQTVARSALRWAKTGVWVAVAAAVLLGTLAVIVG